LGRRCRCCGKGRRGAEGRGGGWWSAGGWSAGGGSAGGPGSGRAGGADAGERLARAGNRLVPGHPHDPLAVRLEDRLAFGVSLAREPVVVPGAAVGFDDEARLRPSEVGDDAAPANGQRHVYAGMCETAAQHEVEYDILELAAGRRRARGDDPREPLRTGTRAEPSARLEQLADVDALQRLRLPDGTAELPIAGRGCKVDERSCGRGQRDAVMPSAVGRVERRGAVHAQARVTPSAPSRHRDLGSPVVPPNEAPDGRRRVVTQDRSRAAGLHGSEEEALQRRVGMADGIDAPVQRMQATTPDAAHHGVVRETARVELRQRDHAPLLRGELGDARVGSIAHTATESTRASGRRVRSHSSSASSASPASPTGRARARSIAASTSARSSDVAPRYFHEQSASSIASARAISS
jgi:hypothetical protein